MESKGMPIDGDPYEAIIGIIKQWIEKFPTMCTYEDYIVFVWTENLGFDTVYLEFMGKDFFWNTDWYEGGKCKLLGFCPISSLEIPEEYKITEVSSSCMT